MPQRRRLLELLLQLLGLLLDVGDLAVALALVVDRVGRDLLARALDPVARRRQQVVRVLIAEFVWKFILRGRGSRKRVEF